jgi:hypothetical protein
MKTLPLSALWWGHRDSPEVTVESIGFPVHCRKQISWHLQSSRLPLGRVAGILAFVQKKRDSPSERLNVECWAFVQSGEAILLVLSTESGYSFPPLSGESGTFVLMG